MLHAGHHAREPVGDDREPLGVDVRQQHRELVSAQARDQVGFAQPAGERAGDRLERVVADLVAVAVVDRLKSSRSITISPATSP